EPIIEHFLAEGHLERQAPNLFGYTHFVIPGPGTMNGPASAPDGGTAGSSPSASGALLPPGLFASAPDLAATFGLRGSGPAFGQLIDHDLMEHVRFHSHTEYGVTEFKLACHFAVQVKNIHSWHGNPQKFPKICFAYTRTSIAPGLSCE